MPENPRVKEILLDNEFLTNQNSNFRSYAEDLADYGSPRKAWINSMRTKGERVNFNFLYDSTLIRSARDLSSGIHSHLTNPVTRWFMLATKDQDLMRRRDVRTYFDEVQNKIFATLNDTNFYNVVKEFYHSTVVFGPGTYSMLEDPKNTASFKNNPVQNVNRVVDRNGELMEIYINFKLNARQAAKMFGKQNVGPSVQKALASEKEHFKEFDFIHFVGERFDRDPRRSDSINLPFRSVWIAKKDRHLISEGGFHEMPYISEVFFEDENDPNGFSPAMMVLAEAKLVNAMKRTVIRAGMKQTDPPMAAPNRGYMLPLNFNPAAMNYYDMKNPKDTLFALPTTQGRVEIGAELIRAVQDDIKDGMFIPLFKTLQDKTKQMPIVEIQQLVAQNMAILGPVIDRYNRNVLGKTIIRLYNMMNRDQALPPPPESLQGADFEIIYLSPLAKAQRQAEINEMQAFMGDVSSIGSIIPSAFHKINEDKLIDWLHRTRGITPEVLREDDEVEKLKQRDAELAQIAQGIQAGHGAAQVAKTAAEAEAVGSA